MRWAAFAICFVLYNIFVFILFVAISWATLTWVCWWFFDELNGLKEIFYDEQSNSRIQGEISYL